MLELTLPESLGTTKCVYCQAEPKEGQTFWEIFIDWYDEQKAVPCCDTCIEEHSKGGIARE